MKGNAKIRKRIAQDVKRQQRRRNIAVVRLEVPKRKSR